MRRGAGLEDGQGPDAVGLSLDDLIGTWSRAEADEMERALRHFETSDEAAWE